MSGSGTQRGPRGKKLTVASLTLAAIALAIADFLPAGVLSGGSGQHRSAFPSEEPGIRAAIDTTLSRFGIDRESVHTWRVQVPGMKSGRVESRVIVPPAFASLAFNHELNNHLAQYGAHVVATERSREQSVTMHIVKDGVTVRSMTFVLGTTD
jgi:hypothetical protein